MQDSKPIMLIFVSALLLLISSGCIKLPEGWGIITPTNNTTTPCPPPPSIADAVRLSCEQQGGEMEPLYDAKSCVIGHRCYMPPQNATNETNLTNVTQRCGGPFGIQCPDGYECSAEGTAYGDCVEKLYENVSCWGYLKKSCPAGYYCELPRDLYGVEGTCTKISNEIEMWCGGYSELECPSGYACAIETPMRGAKGACVSQSAGGGIPCGGAGGAGCPAGMVCVRTSTAPGAEGTCSENAGARKDPREYCFSPFSGGTALGVNDCGRNTYRIWLGPSLLQYAYVDSLGNILAECFSESGDAACGAYDESCRGVANMCNEPSAGLSSCPPAAAGTGVSPVCARTVSGGRVAWLDFESVDSACFLSGSGAVGYRQGTCDDAQALYFCPSVQSDCRQRSGTVCALISNRQGSRWEETRSACEACSTYSFSMKDALSESGAMPEMPAVLDDVVIGFKYGNCAGSDALLQCPQIELDPTIKAYSPVCVKLKLGNKEIWKDYLNIYAACSANESGLVPAGYREGYC